MLLAVALGLALAGFAGWVLVVKDPQGGEPTAVVELPDDSRTGSQGGVSGAAEAGRGQYEPRCRASRRTSTVLSPSSMARPASGRRFPFASAEIKPGGGDTRLLEQTRHGFIPKIAADGTRPSDAYAAPRPPAEATEHAAHRHRGDGPWHRHENHRERDFEIARRADACLRALWHRHRGAGGQGA